MLAAPDMPLPRGRHGLSREAVESVQRTRILVGLAEAVHEHGYADTAVADVIKRAGVSRETFYRLYNSKLDCFLAAFDAVADGLGELLADGLDGPGGPEERFAMAVHAYLDAVAAAPAFARLFLVEAHAAGPEAMRRRAALHERLADGLAGLFGAVTDEGRFACRMVVAGISALVAEPVAAGDVRALRRLAPPIIGHVRGLVAGGVL